MSKVHVRNHIRRQLGGRAPVERGKTGVWFMENPVNPREASPYRIYHLRCMRDGRIHTFVDDGADRNGTPLNGRQALIRALKKEVAPNIPLFFSDEPLQVPYNRVGDTPVPVNMKVNGTGIYDAMLADEKAQREASAEMARLEIAQRDAALAQAREMAANSRPLVAAAEGALPDAAKLKAENEALRKQLAEAQSASAPKLDGKAKAADDGKPGAKGK